MKFDWRAAAGVARGALRGRFWLRWALATLIGWTAGLYLGVWTMRTPLLCGGWPLVGAAVGAAQWLALRGVWPVQARRYVFASAAASLAGITLALLLAGLGIFGLEVWAIGAGAAIGGSVGVAQGWVLGANGQRWVIANLVGGGLCGLLTITSIIGGLPVGLAVGSALFGALTGWALSRSAPATHDRK
mgnify:CR=1 FL=1